MRARIAILAASFCLASASALAQTPTPAAKRAAPKTPPEVKRGVYAEFDFGTLMFLGNAGANVQPGVMAGFAVGADIGRYLKVEGRMLNATSDSTGKIYKDPATPEIRTAYPCPDGDASNACVTSPDVQASIVTGGLKAVYPMSDKLEVHGLVGGGLLMSNPAPEQIFEFDAGAQLTDPTSVESGSTVVVGGGGGMQYYTRLRHFSVGADFAVWAGGGGLMVTLYPTIKYTF